MKHSVILILILLFMLFSCTNEIKEDVNVNGMVGSNNIKINENEYVTLGNWNVMLKEIFEYSGEIRADLDIFSGKPIDGYEAPEPVSPRPDFQGYGVGDELNLESNVYIVVDIKKTGNELGFIILKKVD